MAHKEDDAPGDGIHKGIDLSPYIKDLAFTDEALNTDAAFAFGTQGEPITFTGTFCDHLCGFCGHGFNAGPEGVPIGTMTLNGEKASAHICPECAAFYDDLGYLTRPD